LANPADRKYDITKTPSYLKTAHLIKDKRILDNSWKIL